MNIGTLTVEMAANVARLQKDMEQARRTVSKTFGDIGRDVERLKSLIGAAFRVAAIGTFVGKLVSVQREFDVLNSSLVTVTGSSVAAQRELAWIKQFAATTPFSLNEVTGAFVRMKALGLDASMEALRSYGNTASAMGTGLNQMIEAVADAATGEFERLKEYGIRASKEGDRVTLTFRGVATTIGNSSAEITEYLQRIGEVDFGGAMETRAATLDGALSNLGDTWDELFRTISSQSVGGVIYDSVQLATNVIGELIRVIESLGATTDATSQKSSAFAAVQAGAARVFETLAVLAVNLRYVLVQVGTELGGIAAQMAALVRLRFGEAASIRQMMVRDAAAARREVDETTARILGLRAGAQETAPAVAALGDSADDAAPKMTALCKATREAKGEQDALKDTIREALALDRERLRTESRLNNEAFDRAFEAAERERLAVEGRIRAGREMLATIQQETQLLGLSGVERETAVAMLELERAGVVRGTEAYEAYAVAIREAIAGREAKRSGIESMSELEREGKRMADQIGQSLSDALMDGGKSAGEYIEGLFRSMVLRPVIQGAVVNPISQGITSAFGGSASAAGGSANAGNFGASMLSQGLSLAGVSGAFGTGMAASFGSMASAGIGGWASAAGSLMGTGTAAGAAAGLGMVAAPIAAAYLLYSLLSSGGERRAGATYGYSATDTAYGSSPLQFAWSDEVAGSIAAGQTRFIGGPSGGQLGTGDVVRESVAATVGGINDLFERLGSPDRIDQFWGKLEQSGKGRGGVFAGGMLTSGAAFGERSWESGTSRTLTADEAIQAFALDLQQAAIQALQAATEIPASVRDIVRDVDAEALTQEQVGGLLQTIESIVSVTAAMSALGVQADSVSTAMLQAAGGADTLASAAASYYQGYYSEAERAGKLSEQLAEQFGELGLQMPSTREEFRALVESLDLTSAEGQATYGTLLTLSGAFGVVADSTTSAVEQIGDATVVVAETLDAALSRIRSQTRTVDDIARSIIDLEGQLARELAGDDRGAQRALEVVGLTDVERGLLEQIWAVRDAREAETIAAAQAAEAMQAQAAAQAAVSAERSALERQILQLTGDTTAIRAAELAAIDESNRGLQERIYALQDEAVAAQEAARAAQQLAAEQARAAQELAAEQARAAQELAAEQARIAAERMSLERQLLQVNGDTAALREMDLAAIDESNRALQQQIWARQDQIAAEQAAARAAEDAARAAAQARADAEREAQRAIEEAQRRAQGVLDERTRLERQLLDAMGDIAAIRALERAALDESNRALYDRINALADEQTAQQARAEAEAQRAAVMSERQGLERQLLQLQGDTAAIRALERGELDAANRALYDRVKAVEDAAAADRLAADVATEREALERRLLGLQGDTAEIRRRELEDLDASNRAIQEQIWALEDAREAWSGVTDSIEAEVRRIRGLAAEDAGQSLASAQARFATATAQARAGDVAAAAGLAGLSQSLLSAAQRDAGSYVDLQRLRASTATSLERTGEIVTGWQQQPSQTPDMTPLVRELETTRIETRAQAAAVTSLLNRLAKIVEGWEAQGVPEQREVSA